MKVVVALINLFLCSYALSLNKVQRFIDGETIELANGEKVRLIDVSCPESVSKRKPVEPGRPEAADFTRAKLEGKRVMLKREGEDHFGRTLGRVYYHGIDFNDLLVSEDLCKLTPHKGKKN